MDDFVKQVGALLEDGQVENAERLVQMKQGSDPLRYQLGMMSLAKHREDLDACLEHATKACDLGATSPAPFQYRAITHAMRSELVEAERFARKACELDKTHESLVLLGNVLMDADKFEEAEEAYQKAIAIDPSSTTAWNGSGTARYRRGDQSGAAELFSKAFESNPGDPSGIQNLMNLLIEGGRLMGALSMHNAIRDMTRGETRSALDLAALYITKNLLENTEGLPPSVNDNDAVSRLIDSTRQRPPAVRLQAARALVDCGHPVEAKAMIERVEGENVAGEDRANLVHLKGIFAERDGDSGAALAHYMEALQADAERLDSACNAINILLEKGQPADLARIEEILARVPPEMKHHAPQLLLNEALYFRTVGRVGDAATNLRRIVEGTHGRGPLGELAAQTLAELQGDSPAN